MDGPTPHHICYQHIKKAYKMKLTTEMMKSFIEKPFNIVERMGPKVIELEPRSVKLSVPLQGNEKVVAISRRIYQVRTIKPFIQ